MNLINFEELTEREKIDIFHDNIMKQKAKIIKYEGTSILLNNKKIHSETERKCLLAEELGHYYYDAYYTLNSDQAFIDKQEYRAKKWKCLTCVSRQSILDCFKRGITNLYDIATELQVEPNMIQFAYDYYKRNA